MKNTKSNTQGVLLLVLVLAMSLGAQYLFALAGHPSSLWMMQLFGLM